MNSYHTEIFNAIMQANKPEKKRKTLPPNIIIKSEIMNPLNQSISRCRIDGNTVFLPPPHEYVMENYADVRKALLNAGAKYKRNTFVFSSDAQPFIDRITGGEKVNIKKEFQWFPTPADVADFIVELADIQVGEMVLEPSAGQGALIKAVQRKAQSFTQSDFVHFFELMPENAQIVEKIPMTIFLGNDFLQEIDDHSRFGAWDKIVANPPFNKNQDIDHIRKMYTCLKKGGRIVSIASKHWQSATGQKETRFREWLTELGADIHEIEAGRFKESGTMISTCIIVINKI